MSTVVSVIVPLWNSAATIEATLSSLLAQSLRDWEAIVIDDGSTDAGPGVANRFAAADPRVRVISQANRGLAAARNAGIQRAGGCFIHFLDADDTLPAQSLETLVNHAARSGGAAFGAFDWIEPRADALPFEVEVSCRSAGLEELLERNRFPVHAQIIERSLLGAERFDESLRSAEDWDLWLRLAARGVRWSGIDQIIAHYHLTPSSMSRDDVRMLDAMTLVSRSAFAAARAGGLADGAASRDRERAVRLRLAMECATSATLRDDSIRADKAASLMEAANPASGELNARALAVAAYWALPQAASVTPVAWRSCNSRWLVGLDRFWSRCAAEGWAEKGCGAKARDWLSELLVDPAQIAAQLVQRASAARSVELLGLGRNGRRIARLLREKAIPFAIRDDGIKEDWLDLDGAGVPARPVAARYSQGAVAVLSPEQEEGLLHRIPREVPRLRWNEVRRELASQVRARLDAAWPASEDRERAA